MSITKTLLIFVLVQMFAYGIAHAKKEASSNSNSSTSGSSSAGAGPNAASASSGTEAPSTAAGAPSDDSDKLDLKQLENKYWSAKDTDFTVVQNRTYTKDKRYFVSLAYGPLVNDAYSYGRMTSLDFGKYFSERMGVQFTYETGAIKNNDSTDVFLNRNSFPPNFNRFVSYMSVNYLIVPFYAKMSFWDSKILYFDIQFAAGLGQMNYENVIDPNQGGNQKNTAFAYNFDITQQFFFHEHWAVRFDIKNKWSKQKLRNYQTNMNNPNGDLGSVTQQDTTVLFGATFFF